MRQQITKPCVVCDSQPEFVMKDVYDPIDYSWRCQIVLYGCPKCDWYRSTENLHDAVKLWNAWRGREDNDQV